MMGRFLGLVLASAAFCAEAAKSKAVAAGSFGTGEAPRHSHALLAARRAVSRGGPDTTQIVSSLQKLAKDLEDEQKQSGDLAKRREKDCVSKVKDPQRSIEKGKEIVQEAKESLATNEADEEGLQTAISGIKKEISSATTEIDTLTTRLKNLRNSQKKAAKQAAASLQQIDRVIEKAYRREESLRLHPVTTAKPTGLNAEVSYLQELGSKLAYAGASPGVSAEALSTAVSFVQTESEQLSVDADAGAGAGSGTGASSAVSVLRTDKQELIKAREKAKRGFNEEEKKLIEMLKIKHEQLSKLEESLKEQQPILADKLKQAAETKRAKTMAERVLARDEDALELAQDMCKLTAAGAEQEKKLRFQLIGLLKMPAKLLESMDTMLFLSKDLQDLGTQKHGDEEDKEEAPPSFVQVKAKSSSSAGLMDGIQAALSSADAEEDKEEGDPSVAAVASAASTVQAALVQAQDTGASTALTNGPFDKVSDMINALLTSLRDQANEEMDLHQWCQESMIKNKKDRQKIRAYMDETATEIHWAKTAIQALDDQIGFFDSELSRLSDHAKQIQTEKDFENRRLSLMLKAHKNPEEVLGKVIVVLRELCELDDKDLQLIQRNRTIARKPGKSPKGSNLLMKGSASSKKAQCLEATKLTIEALAKLDELDTASGKYLSMFNDLSKTELDRTKEAINQRSVGLRSSKADRAKRASDLATSQNDEKQSLKDLALVEEADKQQEQKCHKTDTREDRMARRAEEIGALKSALKVLEGEEIPVETALTQTGSATHTVHS